MVEKLDKEKQELTLQMAMIIKSGVRKACKKDDELEKFEKQSFELVDNMKEKIKVLEENRAMMQQKINKLFDCEMKRKVESSYLVDNNEYMEDMKQLFNKVNTLE